MHVNDVVFARALRTGQKLAVYICLRKLQWHELTVPLPRAKLFCSVAQYAQGLQARRDALLLFC